jgi:hypothetical protein
MRYWNELGNLAGGPAVDRQLPIAFGLTIMQLPQAMADTQRYVRNIALWLAQRA